MSEIEKAKDELRKEFRDRHGESDASIKSLTKELSELVGELKLMMHRWDSIKTDTVELQHKVASHDTEITTLKVQVSTQQKAIDDWSDIRKKIVTWLAIFMIGSVASITAYIKGGS